MVFYVGTLTRIGGRGIIRYTLEGNHMSPSFVEGDAMDPNYLILSKDGKKMYSTCSNGTPQNRSACMREYEILPDGLKLLAEQSADGSGPCFMTLSPDGRFLYVANYGSGSIAVLPVENGLGPILQSISHTGHGPDAVRQEAPHVHQVLFVPGTQYLVAADLGTDELVVYSADVQTGLLTEVSRLHIPGGPRHMVFADSTRGYLAHELSSEVTVLSFKEGKLSAEQTLSTLPEDYPKDTSWAGAIRLNPDGTKVYVSNRTHGSLAEFDVRKDGTLQFARFLFAGEFPRDFVRLEDGRFLVADQHAGVYLIDCDGNRLDFCEETGAVAICVTES